MIKRAQDVLTPPLGNPHDLAASQAQTDAAKWLLPVLAASGTVGALRGAYNSYQKKRQAQSLSDDLNYQTAGMPLATGKSASLAKTAEEHWLTKFLSGGNAHQYGPMAVPWFPAAAVGTAYAGHALGKYMTQGVGNRNLTQDSDEELQKSKQRYLQAVRQPVQPEEIKQAFAVVKSASDFFSMDNMGPALGVGTGLVGGLSAVNLIRGYQLAKQKKQKETEAVHQQALDSELAAMRPGMPNRIPQPVTFDAA